MNYNKFQELISNASNSLALRLCVFARNYSKPLAKTQRRKELPYIVCDNSGN